MVSLLQYLLINCAKYFQHAMLYACLLTIYAPSLCRQEFDYNTTEFGEIKQSQFSFESVTTKNWTNSRNTKGFVAYSSSTTLRISGRVVYKDLLSRES